MARLLITGASGLLGSNLAVVALGEHQVRGVYHRHAVEIPGVEMVAGDLTDPQQAARLVDDFGPDWVVHCAAASEVDRCELDPAWAWRLNREMAKNVAEAARQVGAQLTHISTDAVFDGEQGGYTEADEPRPITIYGESKLAGERAVGQAYPEALVLRINLFGWGPTPKPSLAAWFLGRLEAGESCPGFTDVFFSPLLAQHLAEGILDLLVAEAHGLLHLPGGTCLSKYEFGVRLAEVFGLNAGLIRPVSVVEAKLAAPRPRRLCLNGGRAALLLGHPQPDIGLGLGELRASRGRLPFHHPAQAGAQS